MEEPSLLLENARAALAAGAPQAAVDFARRAAKLRPLDSNVLHILAVAERRNGGLEASRRHFIAALNAAPNAPEIHINFGNLLDEMGEYEQAREHYRRAASLPGANISALINLAHICRKLGALEEGVAAAERATVIDPRNPRAWLYLGLLRTEAADLPAAEAALDRALQLAPADGHALAARAKVELRRGGDAIAAHDKALAARPGDPDLLLGRVASLHAEGQTEAAKSELRGLTNAHPAWLEAHNMLASLHAVDGAPQLGADSFRRALSTHKNDPALWLGYAQARLSQKDYAEALNIIETAIQTLGDPHPVFLGFKALALDELGEHDRAAALLTALDTDAQAAGVPDEFAIALTKNLLRTGRTAEAAMRAHEAVQRGARGLWPYLATAWRILGDPRWEWLEGDERFAQAIETGASAELIEDLANLLRRLHTDSAAPLGQSIAGGTQTRGELFARREAPLAALSALLMEGVKAYVAQLPPADDRHPLLSGPRDRLRFSGSWSVRLSEGGFHVNHFHPEGWLSSAFYLVTPPHRPGDAEDAGWLTLGEPLHELGLNLPPFRRFRPEPGRLVLFPSYTWHGTRPCGAGERLTVAFDVVRRGA